VQAGEVGGLAAAAPQYWLLLFGLMHVPLQFTNPVVHDREHVPFPQMYPVPFGG
jgi:hypothetical protein